MHIGGQGGGGGSGSRGGGGMAGPGSYRGRGTQCSGPGRRTQGGLHRGSAGGGFAASSPLPLSPPLPDAASSSK